MSFSNQPLNNSKAHFIQNDSLVNVSYDINFSVFRKYACKAGCTICYIREDWIDDKQFSKFIPIHKNTNTYQDRLQSIFDHFSAVTIIDDLRFVRDQHPELYRFYTERNDFFFLGSMTDNAIFRHLPVFENNEVKFIAVRDISISEFFLSKVNLKKLFDALDLILSKTKINKIKIILSDDILKPHASQALYDWCVANGVNAEKQYEFGADGRDAPSILDRLNDTRYNESTGFTESTTYNENLTEIFPVHSESLFLMYDQFYSELKSATRLDRSEPFATLGDFDDPVSFLSKVLAGKVVDYTRYLELITNKENGYYKYFDYVVKSLVVNPNFNFIPKVSLNPTSKYYSALVNSGRMIDTKYGLLAPQTETVVPLYSFRDHEPNDIQNR